MQIKKILILINGDEVDEESINLICKLENLYSCEIYAVYVIIVPLTIPIDTELIVETARAQKILEEASIKAKAQSCIVQRIVLKTRAAGPAIIKIIEEYNIDMVLIGIKYATRFGQFSLGNIAPHILKNASCQVLLYQLHAA